MSHRLHGIPLVLMVLACCAGTGRAQTIVTIAGGGRGDGVPATSVAIPKPTDVAFGPTGDLYIADAQDCVVLRVARATRRIAIVAGDGDCGFVGDGGPATGAKLQAPSGLAVDRRGNLFIADTNNHRVRRVEARTGQIETIAGTGTAGFSGDRGPAVAAALNQPSGLAVDASGALYIADTFNHRIRRVDRSGRIDTVAGPAVRGVKGELAAPSDAVLDGAARIYIADTQNKRVVLFDLTTRRGRVVVAGDAEAARESRDPLKSRLDEPVSVAVARAGLYITDGRGVVFLLDRAGRLRAAVTPRYWLGWTLTPPVPPDQETTVNSALSGAAGLAVAPSGDLYIADPDDARVAVVPARTGLIATYAGNGTWSVTGDGEIATRARLTPTSVALDRAGALYVTDDARDGRVRKIDPIDGTMLTVIGSEADDISGLGQRSMAMRTSLRSPAGVAVDPRGNIAVSTGFAEARLRLLNASTGMVTTLVGGLGQSPGFRGDGGPARAALLNEPQGLAFDSAGNLYIADLRNSRLRRIDATTSVITSVPAGASTSAAALDQVSSGGSPQAGGFFGLQGVAVDSADNVYVAETCAHRIRRVEVKTGQVTTIAGNGREGYSGDGGPALEASLDSPAGVAVDAAGNVYIADTRNHRVRRVAAATGIITTVAGTGDPHRDQPGTQPGFAGDGGPATEARLYWPTGVAVGSDGTLYIADLGNGRVRAVLPTTGPTVPWLRRILGLPVNDNVPASLVPLARTCELLTRHLPVFNREGELRLQFHEHEYVTAALEELRTADPAGQVRAGRWLRILLSPMARSAIASMVRGSPAETRIRRPVERPVLHPEAARVRAAALAVLTGLAKTQRPPGIERDEDPLVSVAELVAEVGDDNTARAVDRLLLDPATRPHRALLIQLAWRLLGLGSADLIDRPGRGRSVKERAREDAELQDNLRSHRAILAASPDARVRWALAGYEPIFQEAADGYRRHGERSLFRALRLGDALLPALRRLAARTVGGYYERPRYQLAIAAITGQVDHELVTQLLEGDDASVGYGLALITWSGSRAFRDELARLLERDPSSGAAWALAMVHLGDALPVLRAARDRLASSGKPCPFGDTIKGLEEAFRKGEW